MAYLFSDPLVRLQVTNFDELRTTIVDDTVNPEFNQSFSFPVRDRRTKLTMTVESHGAFMNDFLGRIVLDVNDYHKPVEDQVRFSIRNLMFLVVS